jgi:hypothetical protein
MIIAIIPNAGSGKVHVAEYREAESAAAARDAFCGEYSPPLPTSEWLGYDTGWSAVQTGIWSYDFASPGLALCLGTLKAQRCEEIDARTVALIFQGFTHAGKVFSLSHPAQLYWTNMYVARAILTATVAFPLRVNTLDDLATHDIADATEVETFYATAVGTVKARLGGGTVLKDAVRAAATQAEVDAVVDSR